MILNNKTILMTGGTGLVGKSTVKSLLEKGARIILLSRTTPVAQTGLIHIPYDLQAPHPIKLPSYNAIVYIAAHIPEVGAKKETPFDAFESTLRPMVRFFDTFVKGDLQKIVFTSTIDIYGRPNTLEFTENEPIHPETPYALAKAMSEEYVRYIAAMQGLDTTILRFSQVYGPHEPFVRVIPFILNALMNEREFTLYGNPQNKRKFLFAADAARAIASAIEGPGGTYHIAGGESSSIMNVIDCAEKISKKKLSIRSTDANAAEAHLLPSIGAAKTILHWEPQYTLHDGLKIVIDTYEK